MNGEIWFQLPPNEPRDWIIVTVAAIIAVTFAVYRGMHRDKDDGDPIANLQARLGLLSLSEGPFVIAVLMWAVLVASLFGGLIFTLYDAVRALGVGGHDLLVSIRASAVTLTAITATLGAAVALPIKLVSMQHTARQTSVAEESLFNDKINAASKDLAAWREVTRVVGGGVDERVLTTREPDLVTRATAIDRLYGLIKERPSEASRIAAMLSLYVREHTVQVGDKIPDVPPVPVPENATPDELREWAFSLQVGRSDLQKAVQAIGRIRDIPGVELEDNAIDLRGANLQAMDLSGLNLGKGKWQSAQMQGASLMGTQMQGAKLLGAQMQGAYLISAQMQGADLSFARMQGAILWSAQMQGANFRDAQMQGADLRDALMQGAAFIDMLINERQIYHHTKDVFGDGSIRIDPALFPTDGDAWPDHWPTKQLEWEEFNRQWRDWVAQNHPDVLQYLPDGVRNA